MDSYDPARFRYLNSFFSLSLQRDDERAGNVSRVAPTKNSSAPHLSRSSTMPLLRSHPPGLKSPQPSLASNRSFTLQVSSIKPEVTLKPIEIIDLSIDTQPNTPCMSPASSPTGICGTHDILQGMVDGTVRFDLSDILPEYSAGFIRNVGAALG